MNTICIHFDSFDIENAKGSGSISTLTFDIEITVEPASSDKPMALAHRVLGRSSRGRLVESGWIWKKQNRDNGADYFTRTNRDFGFNANLGRKPNDETLKAFILWGPKDAA
ncbi:DUF736 family protein [Ruegeria sp. HKCCSA071]|uniref:DUF736 family protein n=1 Tax=Ruegeria sp. HKCCSA071 TaxID=2794834 RepID=UPI001AE9634B|nr:DUF736 family protein [Ruegeria sp. HKCCSA071]